MTDHLKAIAAGVVMFALLDALWLGVVMKNFYRSQLAPIARMADGGLAPIWSVAALVYVLLGLGVAMFVVPRASTAAQAAGLGALLGLVVYGVYDLTNYSTLAQWPASVTAADIVWGVAATAIVAAAVFLGVRR
jgi:uncharacterized membrane protein